MSEKGLHAKYEVYRDGEEIEDCFVLEPDNDPAAQVALRAYAMATGNDDLAEDLFEKHGFEKTPEEQWEEHNESFSYDPPEKPADAWSSEEYRELKDRVISRQTRWFCNQCSGRGPIASLGRARRHVESSHGQDLVEQHETPREEQDTATDGGETVPKAEQRKAENHGLDAFGGDDE
jgi:hypothetical protein